MLNEAKLAMAITGTAYDGEICDLLMAGAKDLQIAGVILPGTVNFVITENGITDSSTLTDPLVRRALITYARMHFRTPDDYERLRESYDLQKCQLMHATGYTDFGEPEESEETEGGEEQPEGGENPQSGGEEPAQSGGGDDGQG